MMWEVVIVFIVCIFLIKVYCGEFNVMFGLILVVFVVCVVVECVCIDLGQIEDVIFGCGYLEGIIGCNIVCQVIVCVGLFISIVGIIVNCFCVLGL